MGKPETVWLCDLRSTSLAAILGQVWSCTYNTLCQVFADKAATTGVLAEVGSVQLSQMRQSVLEV